MNRRGCGTSWRSEVDSALNTTGKDLATTFTAAASIPYWKRTVPPAALNTLDAPDREACVVRRSRTNTPLQALVLLNDPTYVEASRRLAERLMANSSDDRTTNPVCLQSGHCTRANRGRDGDPSEVIPATQRSFSARPHGSC